MDEKHEIISDEFYFKLNENEDTLMRSLDVLESTGMGAAPEYAAVLLNLADTLAAKAVLLREKGNHRDSLYAFRRALELTKRFSEESIEFAICKRDISEVFELLGDVPAALEELSDSLRIMEKILGPDHASVSDVRKKLDKLTGTGA